MTELRFRLGDSSYAASELVFHTGRRQFANVCGISDGRLLLHLHGFGEYGADPDLVRRDVRDAFHYARKLATIDETLRNWFLGMWNNGLTVDQCKELLRSAAKKG